MSDILDRDCLGELLQWGRIGSFYPSLSPDTESVGALESVQSEILNLDPDAKTLSGLHATLFYCKPVRLFEYIKQTINPDINEALLYIDLRVTLGTMMLTGVLPGVGREIAMHTVPEIQPFGDGNVAALQLAPATSKLQIAKDLLRYNLGRHGVDDDAVDLLAQEPDFRWLLGDLNPHISLAESTNVDALRAVAVPEVIVFDGLGYGSSKMPEDIEPKRWFILGM